MRKIMLVLVLALVVTSCAAPEPVGNNANQVANINAATPAASPVASPAQADIEARERQAWDAVKAKNGDALGSLLTDDFVYVSDDAVYDKAGAVKGVQNGTVTDATLSNFKMVTVDKDVAALTYDVAWKGTQEGKEQTVNLRASSAWINRNGTWLAAFHQDTVKEETHPSASPTASPAASPASSPAATPGASPATPPATATDAEKQVWEALKNKNWDAFGNFMTSDAIEVEPDGVYTKAQSIEGVKNVNFSHVTSSDWKEVKLDADASLVTYKVTSPDKEWQPTGMRHSSIWVNRGGRWQVAFHQGTVIATPKK
ncbi:MAG: nuclear transport factor 2 family protein [Acidobacteria bacterium]|nr:nuclear transport factor 2 family protein [Acidobacteriota bacterium]